MATSTAPGSPLRQPLRDRLTEHEAYIHQHGENMPVVRDWTWPAHGR